MRIKPMSRFVKALAIISMSFCLWSCSSFSEVFAESSEGLGVSSTDLVGEGWTSRIVQVDLAGDIHRLRIFVYGNAPLSSGDVSAIEVSLNEKVNSSEPNGIAFPKACVVSGDEGENLFVVGGFTGDGDVDSHSGGGCAVGSFPLSALVLLLGGLPLFRK